MVEKKRKFPKKKNSRNVDAVQKIRRRDVFASFFFRIFSYASLHHNIWWEENSWKLNTCCHLISDDFEIRFYQDWTLKFHSICLCFFHQLKTHHCRINLEFFVFFSYFTLVQHFWPLQMDRPKTRMTRKVRLIFTHSNISIENSFFFHFNFSNHSTIGWFDSCCKSVWSSNCG